MVLALALGVVGTVVGGDLRLPEAVTTALSAYLLFAIGLKGGVARSAAEPAELVLPTLATLALVVLTPIVAFVAARRLLPIDRADAGGFFRAIGSVFDCLAAVAILTLQVPLKVRPRQPISVPWGWGRSGERRPSPRSSRLGTSSTPSSTGNGRLRPRGGTSGPTPDPEVGDSPVGREPRPCRAANRRRARRWSQGRRSRRHPRASWRFRRTST